MYAHRYPHTGILTDASFMQVLKNFERLSTINCFFALDVLYRSMVSKEPHSADTDLPSS
jgi:hypothetical protein